MDDAYVHVSFDTVNGRDALATLTNFHDEWAKKGVLFKGAEHILAYIIKRLASAPHSDPVLFGADTLRRLYPKHSIILTTDPRLDVSRYPAAQTTPLEDMGNVTSLLFVPLARMLGTTPGALVESTQFGGYRVMWQNHEFLYFTVQYALGVSIMTQMYILHEGAEEQIRHLLLLAGAWAEALHDEIWVFNDGMWAKNHALWSQIQKANWEDIILKENFKINLRKDVFGFFASEEVYKNLAIPWKRGLIMYGPPGNGKTISIKAIMKTCSEQGYMPLYVKSFKSWMGEEASMALVFSKARQVAPCILILEDLDALIDDSTRSFFLNQVDGLEGNDGLLIIGTTNHFDRLDPGLSTRPSRFDRKYKFDDPDLEERTLYAKYWQRKLAKNNDISFSDELVVEIATLTDRFSFAYLKEAFVASLVLMATDEGQKSSFASVIKSQIQTLRKQLDKSLADSCNDNIEWSREQNVNNSDGSYDEQIQTLRKQLEMTLGRHESHPPGRRSDADNSKLLDGMPYSSRVRAMMNQLTDSVKGELGPKRQYRVCLPRQDD